MLMMDLCMRMYSHNQSNASSYLVSCLFGVCVMVSHPFLTLFQIFLVSGITLRPSALRIRTSFLQLHTLHSTHRTNNRRSTRNLYDRRSSADQRTLCVHWFDVWVTLLYKCAFEIWSTVRPCLSPSNHPTMSLALCCTFRMWIIAPIYRVCTLTKWTATLLDTYAAWHDPLTLAVHSTNNICNVHIICLCSTYMQSVW